MATNAEDATGTKARKERPIATDWRSVLYFMLHGFGFVASTLLMTWGLFFLFFLAIGGFSFDGFIHQLITSPRAMSQPTRPGQAHSSTPSRLRT